MTSVQKIKKTLNNTQTTKQKLTNSGFRNTKSFDRRRTASPFELLGMLKSLCSLLFCYYSIFVFLKTRRNTPLKGLRHIHTEITFEWQNHSFQCGANMSPKQYIQRYDKEKETLLISFRNPQFSFKFVHPCLYILYDLLCYFFLVFNR